MVWCSHDKLEADRRFLTLLWLLYLKAETLRLNMVSEDQQLALAKSKQITLRNNGGTTFTLPLHYKDVITMHTVL